MDRLRARQTGSDPGRSSPGRPAPTTLPESGLLALQRSVGNRAVLGLLARAGQHEAMPETGRGRIEVGAVLGMGGLARQQLEPAPPEDPAAPRLAGLEPVEVTFDPKYPWLFTAVGPVTEAAILESLYGAGGASMRLVGQQVVELPPGSTVPRLEDRYVAHPDLLKPPYRAQYEAAMAQRRAALDADLKADVARIGKLLDYPRVAYPVIEQDVIDIFWKWAREPFPNRPASGWRPPQSYYLDKLISALFQSTRTIGTLIEEWTSLYSMIFNRFERTEELRRIQATYSRLHADAKPIAEVSFFGMFWEDVKSGKVASRIGNYFKGMAEAGLGLVEGVKLLITDPGKVAEAIWNLPHTVKVVWENREQLWNDFVNADPDEQARIIGRLFGELEIAIATVAAGGGEQAATAAPAVAKEVVSVGGGAAALGRAGAGAAELTGLLGKAGVEAARMWSLMSKTFEGSVKGKAKAEQLEQSRAAGARPGQRPTKQPKPKGQEVFGELTEELRLPKGGKRRPGLTKAQAEALLEEARAVDTAESIAGSYRVKFKSLHPDWPGGKQWQVHHSIPQKFRKRLKDAGIDVDSPGFLRGVRTTAGETKNVHQKITNYWQDWHRSFKASRGREPTAAEVIQQAKEADWRFQELYWEVQKAEGIPVPVKPKPKAKPKAKRR